MALRLLAMALRTPTGARAFSYADKIGKREIVGYGCNGLPVYVDRVDYPMPAIRFKEDTPEILVSVYLDYYVDNNLPVSKLFQALREKEKGDWKKLSLHEKKVLYRASFCQTFEEIKAPTGEWKVCVAGLFVATSLALMITIWLNTFGKYQWHRFNP